MGIHQCKQKKKNNPKFKINHPQNQTQKNYVFNKSNLINIKTTPIQNNYLFLQILGKGSYGQVKKAIHKKTNKQFAIKSIKRISFNQSLKAKFYNQVQILRTLDHPNIVKIYQVYQNLQKFYIVTQIFKGPQLTSLLINDNLQERFIAKYMKQIFSAVNCCHHNQIIHRDLKPQNIIFETNQPNCMTIKVIDFGVSKFMDSINNKQFAVGTISYIAPQVLTNNYNKSCDLWSCGVILYLLLSKQLPFKGKTEEQILYNVSKGQYSLKSKKWSQVSNQAKDLITKLLEKNNINRISAQEALKHPWIIKYKQKQVQIQFLKQNLQQINLQKSKYCKKMNKFQQGIYTFMINFLYPQKQLNEIKKIFQEIDQNGDGQITQSQLMKCFIIITRLLLNLWIVKGKQ